MAGEELRDQDLSEDEDLSPDQPSFVGLFKLQLFRSLLHKAKTTTRLGLSRQTPTPRGDTFEAEEIVGPKLFNDVLQR